MPRINKDNPEFSREREFKVILEDLHKEFHVFGESLEDVRERLGRVEIRLERVESDVSVIKLVVPTLATKRDLESLSNFLSNRLQALEAAR